MISLILLFTIMVVLGMEWDYYYGIPSIPADFDDELDQFMKDNK